MTITITHHPKSVSPYTASCMVGPVHIEMHGESPASVVHDLAKAALGLHHAWSAQVEEALHFRPSPEPGPAPGPVDVSRLVPYDEIKQAVTSLHELPF